MNRKKDIIKRIRTAAARLIIGIAAAVVFVSAVPVGADAGGSKKAETEESSSFSDSDLKYWLGFSGCLALIAVCIIMFNKVAWYDKPGKFYDFLNSPIGRKRKKKGAGDRYGDQDGYEGYRDYDEGYENSDDGYGYEDGYDETYDGYGDPDGYEGYDGNNDENDGYEDQQGYSQYAERDMRKRQDIDRRQAQNGQGRNPQPRRMTQGNNRQTDTGNRFASTQRKSQNSGQNRQNDRPDNRSSNRQYSGDRQNPKRPVSSQNSQYSSKTGTGSGASYQKGDYQKSGANTQGQKKNNTGRQDIYREQGAQGSRNNGQGTGSARNTRTEGQQDYQQGRQNRQNRQSVPYLEKKNRNNNQSYIRNKKTAAGSVPEYEEDIRDDFFDDIEILSEKRPSWAEKEEKQETAKQHSFVRDDYSTDAVYDKTPSWIVPDRKDENPKARKNLPKWMDGPKGDGGSGDIPCF